MVMLTKKEWHQVCSEYFFDMTPDVLEEIYPDMDEGELTQLMKDLEEGNADIEEIVSDAMDNDVEIEWEHDNDDWWTHRKGGFDITYELGD